MKHLEAKSIQVILLAMLSSCATKQATFVTSTSIGIDLDTAPQHVSVAYNRTDGFIGPRSSNGALPPVVSYISSDLGIFKPKVQQVYATGNAAIAAISSDTTLYPEEDMLDDENEKLVFFGTQTTTGIGINFTGGAPDGFIFGYKRKEFSVIPLGSIIETKDGKSQKVLKYPAVLANMSLRTDYSKPISSITEDTGTMTNFFATGTAAVRAAHLPQVRSNFQTNAGAATRALSAVSASIAPDDVQKDRIAIAEYLKGLTLSQQNQLATSLDITPVDAKSPLVDLLNVLAQTNSKDGISSIKQKIKILFDKDF